MKRSGFWTHNMSLTSITHTFLVLWNASFGLHWCIYLIICQWYCDTLYETGPSCTRHTCMYLFVLKFLLLLIPKSNLENLFHVPNFVYCWCFFMKIEKFKETLVFTIFWCTYNYAFSLCTRFHSLVKWYIKFSFNIWAIPVRDSYIFQNI